MVAKDEHTDWKKAHDGSKDDVVEKQKRRNDAPVVAWPTTPAENAVSQSWSQQPSHTKIGETLNNYLNQERAHSQCPNLRQHDKNHLQRLT